MDKLSFLAQACIYCQYLLDGYMVYKILYHHTKR